MTEQTYQELKCIIVNFEYKGWLFEIFAQPQETKRQNAFRHMVIENRILNLADNSFRQLIISLKKQGMKTEPAFAKLLAIEGDPYIGLLEFEILSDVEIKEILAKRVTM
nr:DUF4269 domain-containing protein [Chengkuizengella marina]